MKMIGKILFYSSEKLRYTVMREFIDSIG